MSSPQNPIEVVRLLGDLTRQLRDQVRSYGEAEKDAALKRHAADQAEARAFMAAEGPVEQRRQAARIAADRQEGEAKVAEALVKVLKSRIRVIETEIDCARTAGATFRAELATLSSGADS